ncbi:MAG: dihydroorotase [Spirochaetales bacterium]|nr:dihydroorotase [Spirochaetales bacterium]
MEKKITIKRPSDLHVHLRQGESLIHYVVASEKYFDTILVMPNIIPPIKSADEMITYRDKIHSYSSGNLKTLMTFKIFEDMSREQIVALKEAGAVAGKLYPKGVTTNSEDGADSIETLFPIFEVMQDLDLVLSIHGENPDASVFDRERAFLPVLAKIILAFPELRVVLEHLSTEESVEFIKNGPDNLVGTITAVHMSSTVDDLLGRGLSPHVFCKPIVQFEKDRKALVKAATSGSSKFFFGSDSAPHLKKDKENFSGAAGVFSALSSLPVIVEIFEKEEALDNLEGFLCVNGLNFYRKEIPTETITLVKEDHIMFDDYYGVVPFAAGKTLKWKVE